jgi:hypothetical protein
VPTERWFLKEIDTCHGDNPYSLDAMGMFPLGKMFCKGGEGWVTQGDIVLGEAWRVGKLRSQEASSSRRNSPQRGVGTWK